MNQDENTKTVWFLAAAVLIVGVAWLARPAPPVKSATEILGQKLFKEFTDPSTVTNLRVLQFDQAKSESVALEIAQVNGLWVIPTHGQYPADAKEHLASAANSLIDLTVTGMAPGFDAGSPPMDPAALRAAQNRFGVVDPESSNVTTNDTGIGTKVTMKDAGGKELASAIIGKLLPDQSDQCYLRITGKDPVYIVKLDPSSISVRFADWIEPDLLKFKTIDLKRVDINNYSIAPVGNNTLGKSPKGEFVLDAAAGDQPWKLVQDEVFDRAKMRMVPDKLAADEELNTTNLESLKTALEDLKIVDVERKPASVPADLRVNKVDAETLETLEERGFFVQPVSQDPNAALTILSNYGEVTVQMADGVRYILRFGATTGESAAAGKAKKKGDAKAEPDKAKESSSPGVDRYLFVTADFNPDGIPKPALEKLPEAPPVEPAPETKTDKKAADVKADAKAAPPADAGKKPEAAADKKDGDKKEADKSVKQSEAGSKDAPPKDGKKDEPKKDDSKKDSPAKTAEMTKDGAKKEEPKKEEPKKDPAKEAKAAQELAAKRAEVEKENKRKQEEYDAKVVAGKKHALELSNRFAQWYYVIPGDTYAKIHLDRKDIVKKKEAPKDAAGAAGPGHEHDHDHDHDHEGAAAPPVSPAATVEQLKKDQPAPPDKK